MKDKECKVIAFYLPQFHAIKENDEAYGKGFTEWTNTKKAKPLFDGHYQPRTPYEKNYYNLLDEGVMEKQAKLAKDNGVYGFCYYHYWFKGGHKLLEQPIERMLKNPKIDIPFCLSWANENWSKRWDGGNHDIIVEQDYEDYEDIYAHVDYLCQFFKDPRYICEDGKPVLLIYKPELIPNLKKVVRLIRKRIQENGFKGVKLIVQYPKYFFDGAHLDYFDAYVQFQPRFIQEYQKYSSRSNIRQWIKKMLLLMGMKKLVFKAGDILYKKNSQKNHCNQLEIRSYDDDWNKIIQYEVKDERLIAGAFVDWDNTARNKNGLVYKGTSPEKFEKYMTKLVEKVDKEYSSEFIFINAWNEWAEGAYLEPDEKYEFAYLNALKKSLKNNN